MQYTNARSDQGLKNLITRLLDPHWKTIIGCSLSWMRIYYIPCASSVRHLSASGRDCVLLSGSIGAVINIKPLSSSVRVKTQTQQKTINFTLLPQLMSKLHKSLPLSFCLFLRYPIKYCRRFSILFLARIVDQQEEISEYIKLRG